MNLSSITHRKTGFDRQQNELPALPGGPMTCIDEH
jgi:hypothetical protein